MVVKAPPTAENEAFVELLESVGLQRGLPLHDQVYALVRKAIVTGRLAPGTAINEVDIAARLGVSRTPVREAVKRVSDQGLVEVFAQNGTFVAPIRQKQVEQAYIIRIALELECVERAARNITTDQLQTLEDLISAHEIALKRDRYDEAIARDDDFHREIANVNNLDMVWKVIDISKAQMDRCRLLSLPSPGAGIETIAQHRAIFEALTQHDEAAATATMSDHLETSMRNTFIYLKTI